MSSQVSPNIIQTMKNWSNFSGLLHELVGLTVSNIDYIQTCFLYVAYALILGFIHT